MSVFFPSQFAGNVDPPAAPTYVGGTVTGASFEIFDKFTALNVTANPVVFKVYLGGTDVSQLVLQRTISPLESFMCEPLVGHELAMSEPVYVYADTYNAVSVRAGGRAR